jgi:hypothetical protein
MTNLPTPEDLLPFAYQRLRTPTARERRHHQCDFHADLEHPSRLFGPAPQLAVSRLILDLSQCFFAERQCSCRRCGKPRIATKRAGNGGPGYSSWRLGPLSPTAQPSRPSWQRASWLCLGHASGCFLPLSPETIETNFPVGEIVLKRRSAEHHIEHRSKDRKLEPDGVQECRTKSLDG